jgi:formylglycine-generating enzyme required for sulfatase activity
MKKHLTLEPASFSEMGVDVPPQIEAAVRHALEKEAADRPASVDVFIQELRDAVGSATRALATTSEDPYVADSSTLVTTGAPPTIPPTSFQSLGGLSNSLDGWAQEQSAASMEAKRLRAQAEILEERARQAAGAQKREQERLDQEARERAAREEEARLKAEAEAKQKADEEAARQREEEEARRLAEEEAQRKADEEARREAEEQAAKIQVEADKRQLAETEAARLHAAAESERVARDVSIQGTQESSACLAAEEQARKAAEESLREEQEARERSERETADRDERGGVEPPVVAPSIPSVDDTLVGPQNLESTQDQRQGVVTQSMYGKEHVPASQPNATGSEKIDGVAPRSVIGYDASEGKSRKPNSFRIAAAVIGIVLLVGGGVAAYLKFKQSGTVVTKPPVVAQPSGRLRPRMDRSPPPVEDPFKAELLDVPGGVFQMGRAGKLVQEAPPHNVTVGPFAMDKTEVTNGEYAEFVAATNRTPPSNWAGTKPVEGQERWPVTDVSLADANAFAEWRSKRDGVKYRLPTEAEWEFAARGGDEGNLYPWGNKWAKGRAAIKDAGFASVQAVGTFPEGKAKWGHVDMIGNVWEWTSSTASYYSGSALTIIPAHRTWAIIRGGSLASDADGNKPISNAYRDWITPTTKNDLLGFRLVREP